MSYPTIGAVAPAFSLPNQNSQMVSLEGLRGRRVVLYFYPKALTPGCTTQACGIRDSRAEIAELNTVVFGISPDPVSRLQSFIEKHELNFDLLSDEDHAVAKAYGVWGPKKFMGKEFLGIKRVTFIIDEHGILGDTVDDFKTKSHHQTLLERLRSHAKV